MFPLSLFLFLMIRSTLSNFQILLIRTISLLHVCNEAYISDQAKTNLDYSICKVKFVSKDIDYLMKKIFEKVILNQYRYIPTLLRAVINVCV